MDISLINEWLGLAQFLVGGVVAAYGTIFSLKWPHRNLWKLRTGSRVTVCLATSARIDTGKYIRPVTGLGQVQALAMIVPSILRGYGEQGRPQVHLTGDVTVAALKNDLILLGGPKNNEYARRVLDEYYANTTFNYVGDLNTITFEGEELTGATRDGKVVEDWAVIMRVPNPYSDGATSVTILAGVHTHGTEAAAEYYVNCLTGWKSLFRRHFVCLVKVEVVEHTTARPRLYKMKRIKL